MSIESPRWVTKRRACELLGLTDGAIRSKMARKWTKGVHYAIIDGRTWVNIAEVEGWITQEACAQGPDEYRSGIQSTGQSSRKRSTSPRLGLV